MNLNSTDDNNYSSQHYSAFDHEPQSMGRYFVEMDRMKVFWIFILCVLILSFTFIFGYWFGDKHSSIVNFVPNNSVDFTKSLNNNKNNNLENNIITESSSSEKSVSDEDLSLLDNANQDPQTIEDRHSSDKTFNDHLINSKNTSKDVSFSELNKHSVKNKETHSHPLTANHKSVVSKNKKEKLPVASHKKTTTNTKSEYVIQIATLASESGANKLKVQFQKLGFNHTFVIKKGVLFRVRYNGGFKNYKDALNFIPKLKKGNKVKDFLILKTNA